MENQRMTAQKRKASPRAGKSTAKSVSRKTKSSSSPGPAKVARKRISSPIKNATPPSAVPDIKNKIVPKIPKVATQFAQKAQTPVKKIKRDPIKDRFLPFSYNETKICLMVRDPHWAYAYWDFSGDTWTWIDEFRKRDKTTRPVLRIHNLDHQAYYDLSISFEAKNWYLELGRPDTTFEAELGFIDSHGRFHLIARSNRIRTPRNGPSTKIDPKWVPNEFAELYKLSGGAQPGGSSSGMFSDFKRKQ
jgi:uncharacterized protein